MKSTDLIRWRGRIGVFIRRSRSPHKSVIRLAGLKTDYTVSSHELRYDHVFKTGLLPIVKNDPLRVLISKGKKE